MSAKPGKTPAAVPGGPAAVASVSNPAGGEEDREGRMRSLIWADESLTCGSGSGGGANAGGAEKKSSINQELWQACAGPLVNLPAAGTLVYYFPQGHSEQVAASMKKDADAHIPNYPNLPSKLLCLLHNVTLQADPETDEVYAQMTLQPVPSYDREALLRSDLSLKSNRSQPEFFCKTLTASDTSTHGGFSVPRRAAEKIFPPLDFSMQPPAQELMARDLHDNVWNFRHIFRGQPKRHLLTTGWSLFVSGKRLFAGDSVLFIRDEKQQLLLGIRRANRQSPNLSSSVLSSDSMHIGILAAAAHAAANNSPFNIFFNPRASPSEFVIPLAKYYKAVYSNQVSLGMRFRMMFETEDSGTRRYMGTITGISDLDPVRWKNSQWRNLQVGWDESTAGERRNRVSIWEIEPVTAPFFICPPPFFRSKRPRQPGMPDDDSTDFDNLFKRTMPWLSDDLSMKDPQALSGLSLVQWMNMQQSSSVATSMQPNYVQPMSGSVMQNLGGADLSRQFSLPAPPLAQPNNLQFGAQRMSQQAQQVDQLQKLPMQSSLNPLGSIVQSQQQFGDMTQQSRQNLFNHTLASTQGSAQILQPQGLIQANNSLQQQQPIPSHQPPRNLPQQEHQNLYQQQQIIGQNQQSSLMQGQFPDHVSQHKQASDNQIQFQLLQTLQQQRQSLLAQQTGLQQSGSLGQLQDPHRQFLDASQSLSRPVTPSQIFEATQTIPNSLPQSSMVQQHVTTNSSQTNGQFPYPLQQQASTLSSKIPGLFPVAGSSTITSTVGAGQSVITDELPSCSTSPSTNNCRSVAQPMNHIQAHRGMGIGEDMAQSTASLFNPTALESLPSSTAHLGKDLQQKSDVKPSLNISSSRSQNQGLFSPQAYLNGAAIQADYLDTSSSTTSVGISQNEVNLQYNSNSLSYNPHSLLLKDTNQDGVLQVDPRSNISCGANGQIGMPTHSDIGKGMVALGREMQNNLSSGDMLASCEKSRDPQAELSSSMVSQQFGVPDMTFNSIDSTMNENNFLNRGPWAPAPQFQRLRTYTKVYKRGAVGRSIDIARYSGYDELKQDLARRFGIEGQLEDRQRIGWKLVYVDHENDVLLVGDDPWEEFVNCVRCIKILSPQEVQQMSLDVDIGTSVLPNQACSSSDNGNA